MIETYKILCELIRKEQFGEMITEKERTTAFLTFLNGRNDLEDTVAEKLDAILSLMEFSGRMNDYYDICYLAHKFDFDGAILTEALKKTFTNRSHTFTEQQFNQNMTYDVDDGMQKKWKSKTSNIL